MLGISGLGSTNAQGSSSTHQPRLVNAAHEFEAQMMQELLKPMTASAGLTDSEDGDNGSAGALGDFASEALGRALSDRGGLGIANQILASFTHSGQNSIDTQGKNSTISASK